MLYLIIFTIFTIFTIYLTIFTIYLTIFTTYFRWKNSEQRPRHFSSRWVTQYISQCSQYISQNLNDFRRKNVISHNIHNIPNIPNISHNFHNIFQTKKCWATTEALSQQISNPIYLTVDWCSRFCFSHIQKLYCANNNHSRAKNQYPQKFYVVSTLTRYWLVWQLSTFQSLKTCERSNWTDMCWCLKLLQN